MRVRSVLSIIAILSAFSTVAVAQVGFYVTDKGTTYHKQDCRTIKGKKVHAVTAEEAKRHKLKACKICKP
jgi:hypothetical protein